MRTDWPVGFLAEAAAEGNAPVWLLCLEIDGVETYLSDRAYPVFLDPIPPPLPWVAGWGSLIDTPGSPSLIYQQVVSMREMRISLLNTAESGWLAKKLVVGQQVSLYLGFQVTHPGHAPPSPALIDTLHVSAPLQYSSGSVTVDVTLVSSLTQLDVPIGVKDMLTDYRYPVILGTCNVQCKPWGVWPFAMISRAVELGDFVINCDRDLRAVGFDPDGGQVFIDFVLYDYAHITTDGTALFLTDSVTRIHRQGGGVAVLDHYYYFGLTTNTVRGDARLVDYSYNFVNFWPPAVQGISPHLVRVRTGQPDTPWLPHKRVEARVARTATLAALGPEDMVLEPFLPLNIDARIDGGTIVAVDGKSILLELVRMQPGDLRFLVPAEAFDISGTATATFRLNRLGFDDGWAIVCIGGIDSIHSPPLGEDGWQEYTVTRSFSGRDDLRSQANWVSYRVTANCPPEFAAAEHVSFVVDVQWTEMSPGYPQAEYTIDDLWARVTPDIQHIADPPLDPARAIQDILLANTSVLRDYNTAKAAWQAIGYQIQGVIPGDMTIRQAVGAVLLQSHGVMYTANGASHLAVRDVPALPLRVLTDHDVARSGVAVQQSDVSNVYNRITVRYVVDFLTGSYIEAVQVDDVVSQGIYGVRPLTVDAYLIRTANHAQGLADYMLETLSSPSSVVSVRGYLEQVDVEVSDDIGLQSAWAALDTLGTVVRTTITPGQVGRVTRVAVDKIVY